MDPKRIYTLKAQGQFYLSNGDKRLTLLELLEPISQKRPNGTMTDYTIYTVEWSENSVLVTCLGTKETEGQQLQEPV